MRMATAPAREFSDDLGESSEETGFTDAPRPQKGHVPGTGAERVKTLEQTLLEELLFAGEVGKRSGGSGEIRG